MVASANLAGISLTEVNATHDPIGVEISRYVDAVSTAIIAGLRLSGGRR